MHKDHIRTNESVRTGQGGWLREVLLHVSNQVKRYAEW